MRAESIRYLKIAGFDFKPAESPDLWSHLESQFVDPQRIGPKFMPLPHDMITTLIARGEDVLLESLMIRHRTTGKLSPVSEVLEMPFVVGTDGLVTVTEADRAKLLDMIDQPGTPRERIIHLLPTTLGAIPDTRKVTVTGGLYADGHTAGFYSMRPGNQADTPHLEKTSAWLATPDEIKDLAHEMERKLEDISVISRHKCEAMIAKARKALNI